MAAIIVKPHTISVGKRSTRPVLKNSNKTGTKKKDTITWVKKKGWKNALTVNAGNGNDVINFQKSKYKNTLKSYDFIKHRLTEDTV